MWDAALFILGAPVVAALFGFLWLRHDQRVSRRARSLAELGWRGAGFDPTPLKPRIEAVRRDPLAGQSSPVGFDFHVALLATVREAVARSAYFEQKEPEHELS